MRQLFPIRLLRSFLVAVALIAAVLAVIGYGTPGPNVETNLRAFVGLSLVATVSLIAAIYLSRGLVRWALCVLLLLAWWSAAGPAQQYYRYFRGGHSLMAR
jgi:hypothetical protein